MSAFLLLLQRDGDWTGWIWFVLFILAPLLSRIFKGLTKANQEPEVAGGETRSERLARRRAEQARSEAEGDDLWKRLARGEDLSVPVEPARSAAEPAPFSLETAAEPAPLSMMGEVSEPSDAPEVSLEGAEEPLPLGALGTPVALAPVLFEATPVAPRARFRLGRAELRRAMVLAEVLAPPVTERPLRA